MSWSSGFRFLYLYFSSYSMYYRLGVGFCSGKLGAVSPLEKFPRALCCRFLYGGKFFEIRSQNDLPKKTHNLKFKSRSAVWATCSTMSRALRKCKMRMRVQTRETTRALRSSSARHRSSRKPSTTRYKDCPIYIQYIARIINILYTIQRCKKVCKYFKAVNS